MSNQCRNIHNQALPQSDAIDQAPRGQQGDHLRIQGLADAIDHIAQGVLILKVEGREELRAGATTRTARPSAVATVQDANDVGLM